MKGSKEPKDAKAPKGTQTLRIPSPLSPQLDQLVYDIIGVGMRVHSVLGPGLLENAYEDAFAVELEQRTIPYEREVPVDLAYQGRRIKRYRLDIVVDRKVVVELKAVARLHPVHSSQMLTYLRLTQLPVGIILNFHERHLRDGIRRHVLRPVKPVT